MNLATSLSPFNFMYKFGAFLPDLIVKPRVRMRIIEIPTVI